MFGLLFECIFQGDSKYYKEMLKCWQFWQILCNFGHRLSTRNLRARESLKHLSNVIRSVQTHLPPYYVMGLFWLSSVSWLTVSSSGFIYQPVWVVDFLNYNWVYTVHHVHFHVYGSIPVFKDYSFHAKSEDDRSTICQHFF